MELHAPRLAVAAVVLAAALLILPGLGLTPLVDWDEGIYGEVARGLYEDGGPHLRWNGAPYDRKPPLLFFAIAGAYSIFGIGEAAVRLPSALAALATAGIVASVVARRSALAALFAGAALLGSSLFLERGGRHASTDSLAILFTVASLALATREGGEATRRRIGAGLACGLAILAKGPLGLLAPAALALADPGSARRWRDAAVVAAIGLGVAAPWYALQTAAGGFDFVTAHFGREVVARALTTLEGHEAPWWYPLWVATTAGGLWVPAALVVVLAAGRIDRRLFDEAAPWTAGALIALALAVATQTKLPWYPLPALPLLAVAAGLASAGLLSSARGVVRIAPAVFAATSALALLGAPQMRRELLDAEREYEPVREFRRVLADAVPDEPSIGVVDESPSLLFYGRRTLVVLDAAELERVLLDPTSSPRAGLVAADRAPALLEAGAVEIGRLGDRVLLYRGSTL